MLGVLTAYLRSTRVQIAAMVYFLLSGALTRLPLFNYLGYEFSAIITIPAAFISGTLAIQWYRLHRPYPELRRTWAGLTGSYIVINLLLLLVPLAVISANAMVVKNCSFTIGLAYFALLPVVTVMFAVPLALTVATLFRKSIAVYYGIITLLLGHIVLITTMQPQLFAYNFILGYFPGITYDETLNDLTPLIVYREFTLIAGLMLTALFLILVRAAAPERTWKENLRTVRRMARADRRFWSIVVFCGVLLAVAHLFRSRMGFEYSADDIQQALGRRTESEHFVLYYRDADYSASAIRALKAESEYHYRVVTQRLRTHLPPGKKVGVYLYPDGDWKRRYIGTTNTNITKPWMRQVHLTTATYDGTLRHELVHVLAGEFGLPLIHASMKMGLNEGLAVAIDWDEGMFTPHQYAAAVQRTEGLEGVEALFTTTGFASRPGSYAYMMTGSFVHYLLERYGADRVKMVFPMGDFLSAFGESRESLLADWKVYLRTVDDSLLTAETIRTLFFQPSIFYKTCARVVATQHEQAVQAFREKRYEEALNAFRRSYDNAVTPFAVRGIIQSLNSLDRPSEALELVRSLPAISSIRTNPSVRLLTGDAFYLAGKVREAEAEYASVSAMYVTEGLTEAALLRQQWLRDSIGREPFRAVYYGSMEDTARTRYLLGIIGTSQARVALRYHYALALPDSDRRSIELLSIIAADRKTPLRYFAAVRAAERAYRSGRYEQAKALFWSAKNAAPTIWLSERLDERIDACEIVPLEML